LDANTLTTIQFELSQVDISFLHLRLELFRRLAQG
jgi:hypothetical protein